MYRIAQTQDCVRKAKHKGSYTSKKRKSFRQPQKERDFNGPNGSPPSWSQNPNPGKQGFRKPSGAIEAIATSNLLVPTHTADFIRTACRFPWPTSDSTEMYWAMDLEYIASIGILDFESSPLLPDALPELDTARAVPQFDSDADLDILDQDAPRCNFFSWAVGRIAVQRSRLYLTAPVNWEMISPRYTNS